MAMSGGVDSSTVAALLASRGVPVIGLTMQLWDQRRMPELTPAKPSGRCCSLTDVHDARAVAQALGIRHYVVNFEERFEHQVVQPFVQEYLEGKTPIPCTFCNIYLKFDLLLELSAGLGADRIATGHYARLSHDADSGRWQLRRGVDTGKDQTYFLFGLTQEQMERTLFPLGEYTKEQVREIARLANVPVAAKSDSQEICFVPGGDHEEFIRAYLKEQGRALPPGGGEIVDSTGKRLGRHNSYYGFTVGQRKGLGVAAPEPLYVIGTNPETRQVIVGTERELFRKEMSVGEVNWLSIPEPDHPVRASVRIRHQHTPAAANVLAVKGERRAQVVFDEPQKAIAPGQAAVFYDGELVLGGGWIE